MTLLELEDVTASYGPVQVLDGVSLTVPDNGAFGILGAKLYYLILNWQLTAANPRGMILSRSGLVWYGGFILAALAILWRLHRLKLDGRKVVSEDWIQLDARLRDVKQGPDGALYLVTDELFGKLIKLTPKRE